MRILVKLPECTCGHWRPSTSYWAPLKMMKVKIPPSVGFLITGLASASVLIGCSTLCTTGKVNDNVSISQYTRHEAISDAEHLQHLNIRDEEGLRSELQGSIALDVQELWIGIQSKDVMTDEEREKSYDALRLIAVESEKYPVATWNADEKLRAIFKAALEHDPVKTEEMRSRNWERNWWIK